MPAADIEAAPTSKNSLWTYVFFLGVGALAIALRAPELSSKGLWLDEAYSVVTARLPLMEMLEKLSSDATPPLYYVFLAPWVRLFGSGEAAARALSIVFSVGGIALMGMLSFRFFSLSLHQHRQFYLFEVIVVAVPTRLRNICPYSGRIIQCQFTVCNIVQFGRAHVGPPIAWRSTSA